MPNQAGDSGHHRLYRGGIVGVDDDPGTVAVRQVLGTLLTHCFGRIAMSLSDVCDSLHFLNGLVVPGFFEILDEYAEIETLEVSSEGDIVTTTVGAISFRVWVRVGGHVEVRTYLATLCELEVTRLGLDVVHPHESDQAAQPELLAQAAQSSGA